MWHVYDKGNALCRQEESNLTIRNFVSSLDTTVLPPSQNSCPTSSLNRENSGIAPKRHTIRNLRNEQ